MQMREKVVDTVASALESAGVIEEARLRRTTALAWPRIVTGFSIMSKHTVDVALVGWTVGATAVAGLSFAFAYWGVAKFVGIGLAGGTVSLVSRRYGGDDRTGASVAVLQSLWVAVLLSAPFVVVYAVFSTELVGVFGTRTEVVDAGGTYLAIVAPALLFEFLNLIGSRTYAGVGDTVTPMVIRAGGAILNIVLSAVLVFGLETGVVGVAVGTVVSVAAVTVFLGWGMLGRRYGVRGMSPSPVPLVPEGESPRVNLSVTRELLGVSAPLMARKVSEMAVVFPLLWIASSFGPVVVAGFEVGRRIRGLLSSFNWGLATASSALVGQELGAGDVTEAVEYGASIIRLSAVVYLLASGVVIVFAAPIAALFVSGAEEVTQATTFVRVAAVSGLALGVNGATTGALLGAGDTRWPFVVSIMGQYALALPVAAIGLVTTLGVGGLYIAFVLGMAFPAVANIARFRGGNWTETGVSMRTDMEVPESAEG
jgi:putative MATE family efflux protein